MGIKVLSLFDGMSCGRLAFEKAGVEVDAYVASEVKVFAKNHTAAKYPDTIDADDVTMLHYEDGSLYRLCRRWTVVRDLSVLLPMDKEDNLGNIKAENGITYIDTARLKFRDKDSDKENKPWLGFDENNKVLAKYKDGGLVKLAGDMGEEEIEDYVETGHEVLPNGEIVKWELGEKIYEGQFDILIGGSPCQNFSVASSANGEKYGLEGPKSRLFFDYLRLKNETQPRFFFLENVAMQGNSEKELNNFLQCKGIHLNSRTFAMQNRPRVYWTNITEAAPVSEKTEAEIDFQRHKLKTLDRLEWALYIKKYPGCYFGYAHNSQEDKKMRLHPEETFLFDDVRTDSTNRMVVVDRQTGEERLVQIEGTKEEIRRIVNFTSEKYDPEDKTLNATAKRADLDYALVADVSYTDEEARQIAEMNVWARRGFEAFLGRECTDREFVDEIHAQLFDAAAPKSPSRDKMRYGKPNFSSCKDITYSDRISCITRKQDRFPNSGNISFGPYYRFVTKFEICEGQTVPYEFLGDLGYMDVQDVCGDGWTVDVIAGFFGMISEPVVADYVPEVIASVPSGKSKVLDIFDEEALREEEEEEAAVTEETKEETREEVQVEEKKEAAKEETMDEVLKESVKETASEEIVPTEIAAVFREKGVDDVLASVEKLFGEEGLEKVLYETYGWNERIPIEIAPKYMVRAVKSEVLAAMDGEEITEDIRKKAIWILRGSKTA